MSEQTITISENNMSIAFFGACNLLEHVQETEWWTIKNASELLVGIIGIVKEMSDEDYKFFTEEILNRFGDR